MAFLTTVAQRGIYFFIYRDLPASRLGGVTDKRKYPLAKPSHGIGPMWNCSGAEHFGLSVSPDKPKLFSVPQW
jgi:hypothetical protein